MQCSLLMAYQVMFEVTLLEDGIVNLQYGTTGITEDGIHAFTFQTFNYYFSAGQFHRRAYLYP